jgi:hypothetical protein
VRRGDGARSALGTGACGERRTFASSIFRTSSAIILAMFRFNGTRPCAPLALWGGRDRPTAIIPARVRSGGAARNTLAYGLMLCRRFTTGPLKYVYGLPPGQRVAPRAFRWPRPPVPMSRAVKVSTFLAKGVKPAWAFIAAHVGVTFAGNPRSRPIRRLNAFASGLDLFFRRK